MIPKIIHYCWFGKSEKNNKIKKYIKKWEHLMSDYQIIEWNENNFDINSNKYVSEAYSMKKYAFVSDYVRLKALYEYGGIYFDTDIEILKKFDEILLKNKDIYGFELENKVMTGVIIARKNSKIIKEFLSLYDNKKFVYENGEMDLTPNTTLFTGLLESKGLILNNTYQTFEEFEIYPIEYFSGYDLKNNCIRKTEKTITIHHYNCTWGNIQTQFILKVKKLISKVIGRSNYEKLRSLFNRKNN